MHEILDWLPTPAAQGVMAFDPTFFVAWPLFLLLMLVLWKLLLQPYADILEERDRLTAGTKSAATEMEVKAQETLTRYESDLAAARAEASSMRETLRQEGAKSQASALEAARSDVEALLTARRAEIEREHQAAQAGVNERVSELSAALVERLLGKTQGGKG